MLHFEVTIFFVFNSAMTLLEPYLYPFKSLKPMSNYSIIWKHLSKDSEIGARLKAKNDFSLPYFVDGHDKELFENQKPVDLHAIHLLKGLLVGYFDKPPAVDTAFAQQMTKTIIEEHLETFGAATVEDFILDLSYHLRDNNGQEASLQALMAGTEVLSNSSTIKYDCCLDLLNCLDDNVLEERLAGIQKLHQLLAEIKTTELHPDLLDDLKVMKSEAQTLRG